MRKFMENTRNVVCHYCGNLAEYVHSSVIYGWGKDYGNMYYCPECKAWVGVHKGTNKPLGILANAELREWKKRAHNSFDKLWKNKSLSRAAAYKWLAGKMGKTPQQTHIGMFNVDDCIRVVQIVNERNEF